jgi:microcystin-dependent protein
MSEPLLGEIKLFGGNFAPAGWALCQGQIMSISQNTALFAILGTTYGGNGVNTFGLPDLRGRVAIGQGQGPGLSPATLGEMAGAAQVTLLTSNLPAHTHSFTVSGDNNAMTATVTGAYLAGKTESGESVASTGSSLTTLSPNSIGLTGQNLPVGIMPPFLCLTYIIAIQGIFPSRN